MASKAMHWRRPHIDPTMKQVNVKQETGMAGNTICKCLLQFRGNVPIVKAAGFWGVFNSSPVNPAPLLVNADVGATPLAELGGYLAASGKRRNANHAKADWRFTTADARIKLKSLYPSLSACNTVAGGGNRAASQCARTA